MENVMQIIMGVIMLIISTVVGIISYYFKKNENRLEEKDKKLESQIDGVKRDLNDYQIEALKQFVTKDEFIRAISNQDKKLDKIYDEVMKLSGRKDN